MPSEVTRNIIRSIDTWYRNQAFMIDPNSLEDHHGLPKAKEFVKYFLDCGLDIKKFIIIMRAGDHRLKPDGVHTGKGKGGAWNEEWRQFIKENPLTYTPEDAERVEKKYEEMIKKYRIDEKAILSPATPKR